MGCCCCICPNPLSLHVTIDIAGVESCSVAGCPYGEISPNGTWTLDFSSSGNWIGSLDGNFFAQVTCEAGLITAFISDAGNFCDYFAGSGATAPVVISDFTECSEASGTSAFGGFLRIECISTELAGACCHGSDCSITSNSDCLDSMGIFLGGGTDCGLAPCGAEVTGACCHDGTCEILSPPDCDAIGGFYVGTGYDCLGDQCPQGACCVPDYLHNYRCYMSTPEWCHCTIGGLPCVFHGLGSTCLPDPCV
jgi:hypothetical protein